MRSSDLNSRSSISDRYLKNCFVALPLHDKFPQTRAREVLKTKQFIDPEKTLEDTTDALLEAEKTWKKACSVSRPSWPRAHNWLSYWVGVKRARCGRI